MGMHKFDEISSDNELTIVLWDWYGDMHITCPSGPLYKESKDFFAGGIFIKN